MPASKVGDGVSANNLIDEICEHYSQGGKTLLIDNIELLFSPELSKINPVDTFKRISRQRPVVLSLPAVKQDNYAIYSTPNSADYFPIPLEEFVVIEIDKE